jgi:CheY-like chemotaxis protein
MLREPVLIVDDNQMNLKMERLVLELEGYQVQIAKNASEVWVVLENFHPRLILMDFGLPGLDGVELTRQLRKNPEYKNLVILLLSSYDQKGDEEKALAAGCDGYIHKPIDTLAFPATVESFLRKGRGTGPSGTN